jgi:hypothetical protein
MESPKNNNSKHHKKPVFLQDSCDMLDVVIAVEEKKTTAMVINITTVL